MHGKIRANCGHIERALWLITNRHGYTSCLACSDRDTAACLVGGSRVEGRLAGTRVVSLTGLPVGTVVERVSNTGSKTPTRGRYASDRMTVVDIFGNRWYANGPKDGPDGQVILRRAEACL